MIRQLTRNLFKKFNPNLRNKLTTINTNPDAPFKSSLSSRLFAEGNGGKKIVGYWLVGTSAAIFGIIVFGGLTRLTESGLSMVDWKLIHFSAPKNDEEWRANFDNYKEFPEYKMWGNAHLSIFILILIIVTIWTWHWINLKIFITWNIIIEFTEDS